MDLKDLEDLGGLEETRKRGPNTESEHFEPASRRLSLQKNGGSAVLLKNGRAIESAASLRRPAGRTGQWLKN